MRNYRTGNSKRSVENEAFESMRRDCGSFYGTQTETLAVLGAVAREVAVLDDLARSQVRAQRATASSSNYRIDFLSTESEKRRFMRALSQLWTNGRSLSALANAINQAIGYAYVTSIWQAMPDVSTLTGSNDIVITSFDAAHSIVSATSAYWAQIYAKYGQAWRSFGKITISFITTSYDANCGTYQITAITPNGWSWKNPNGFVTALPYAFLVKQSSGTNCPLSSDLNGVSATDPSDFSAPGGTNYTYKTGDAFWSSIEKLRVQTVNANAYERRVAEAFLCAAVPAWVDFDFALFEFFQLASSNNDPNFATSKLDGQTRMT